MTTTTAPSRQYILTIWNGEEIIVDPSDLASLNWAKNIISKALKYNHPGEFKHTVATRQIADIDEAIAALTPPPAPKARDWNAEINAASDAHDWELHSRLWEERRHAEVDADEAQLNDDEIIQVKRSDLEMLQGLVGGFHAVKQIRAFAAEENADTKRAALAMLKVLLGTEA